MSRRLSTPTFPKLKLTGSHSCVTPSSLWNAIGSRAHRRNVVWRKGFINQLACQRRRPPLRHPTSVMAFNFFFLIITPVSRQIYRDKHRSKRGGACEMKLKKRNIIFITNVQIYIDKWRTQPGIQNKYFWSFHKFKILLIRIWFHSNQLN